MAQTPPPAGWYLDPYQKQKAMRYWDGARWTGKARSLPEQRTTAPDPARRQEAVSASAPGTVQPSADPVQIPTPGKQKRISSWVAPGRACKIGGYLIPDGMIYVGRSLPLARETSIRSDAGLIHPKLKVSPPQHFVPPLGYYPDYTDLKPPQRGRYLEWLSTGRKDYSVDMGYLFLFFYGLEYRLLAEAGEDRVSRDEIRLLLNEVARLQSSYQRHLSLSGYADRLMAYNWIRWLRHEQLPGIFDLDRPEYGEILRLMIASVAQDRSPVDAKLALTWLKAHPQYKPSTVAKRYGEVIDDLFTSRYQEQFAGDPLMIRPSKHPLIVRYDPASPALRSYEYQVPGLGDAFTYSSSLDQIKEIYDGAVEDMEPLSRFEARKAKKRTDRAYFLSLMPVEIIRADRSARALDQQLAESLGVRAEAGTTPHAETQDHRFIRLDELLKALESEDATDNKETNAAVTKILAALGYGLAPDQELHGAKDEELVLFRLPAAIDADQEFQLAVLIVRLGAMIIRADETMAEKELAVLHNMIKSNPELDEAQKASLQALTEWSARGAKKLTLSKKKFEHLDDNQRQLISELLISLARVDGTINPKETILLERIYTALGLDKSKVTTDLHRALATEDPVLVAKGQAERSFTIPKPETADVEADTAAAGLDEKPVLTLDMELIKLREQETAEVKDILSEVFADEPDQAEPTTDADTSDLETTAISGSDPFGAENSPESRAESAIEGAPDADSVSGTPTALEALEPEYRGLLDRLLEQDEWEISQAEELCAAAGVMLDGALEIINEWSIENADEPLIESADKIYVDLDLGSELQNG